ncbi:hypothetical protein MML48_8g00003473 [Holotrichia oblita]|uniref:Uncharacterized protein n=1 Tax=Holotrichia oblita TaxID=644536 RepID=A0ACB9SPA6_HOLOL|nr:hypothetical protein MML48_8g00003473 [Holotrichia oblita]
MTAKPTTTNFWWLKKSKTDSNLAKSEEAVTEFLPSETKLTTSLAEFLEKENEVDYGAGGDQGDVDIDTILEEINRIAAQSPLGPFEKITGERSVEDLMKEAEKIYNESSKSFEQLSQHSATSHNISEELNTQSSLSTPAQSPIPFITENDDIQRHGTPTPKSVSPTLENNEENKNNGDDYSDDFSENKSENTHDPSLNGNSDDDISNSIASLISPVSPKKNDNSIARPIIETSDVIIRNNVSLTELTIKDINNDDNEKTDGIKSVNTIDNEIEPSIIQIPQQQKDTIKENFKEIEHVRKEVLKKDSIIEHLIEENKCLKEDMKELQDWEQMLSSLEIAL